MSNIEITSEMRREWGRRGGLKRAQQASFQQHQSNAGKRSAEVNDMAALGHKGAQGFMLKYGYARLYHLCRAWRLSHPSSHEQDVMDILCTLGLEPARDYEREYEIEPYLSVDFAMPLLRAAIEVNGKVHYDPLFDDPRRQTIRAQNDAAKIARLHALGWRVLVIDYRNLSRAETMIREFILGA